ncbi:MAG: hypothetical protein PHW60_13245 [Kiritimatiellae bacterium]|nr:hypothetical protein [Kiritimatiellia bacterium]
MQNAETQSLNHVNLRKSKHAALKNIQEAIALCLEVRSEQGMPYCCLSPPVVGGAQAERCHWEPVKSSIKK